jgi:hypothetical protein
MERKKIAILIVGEIRTNSLGKGNNTGFVDTFKKNFLNKDVISNYDINIFFVTDKIDEEKANNYFGDYLKGLIQVSKQNENDLNLNEMINNYMNYYNYRKSNPDKYPITLPRSSYIHTNYKLYLAYKLMKEYEETNIFNHDYILKIRPDMKFTNNFYDDIKNLENNNLEISFCWDFSYFGRYDIMSHICKLIFLYGKYNYGDIKHDTKYTRNIIFCTYDYLDLSSKLWDNWCESPEVQLFEHVLDYCYKNNIDYNKLSPNLSKMFIFEDRQ